MSEVVGFHGPGCKSEMSGSDEEPDIFYIPKYAANT